MFCEHCGGTLPEDSQFCEQCGTPVKRDSEQMPPQPSPAPRQAARGGNRLILPLIAVCAVGLAAAGFFLWRGMNSREAATPAGTRQNSQSATQPASQQSQQPPASRAVNPSAAQNDNASSANAPSPTEKPAGESVSSESARAVSELHALALEATVAEADFAWSVDDDKRAELLEGHRDLTSTDQLTGLWKVQIIHAFPEYMTHTLFSCVIEPLDPAIHDGVEGDTHVMTLYAKELWDERGDQRMDMENGVMGPYTFELYLSCFFMYFNDQLLTIDMLETDHAFLGGGEFEDFDGTSAVFLIMKA